MKYCKLISAFALVAATVGFAAPAMALSFTLDTWQGSGTQTGPFGTVTLTTDGTGVDVLVHLANNEGFVHTGAGDALDFYLATPGSPPTAISPITIANLTSGFGLLSTTAGTYNAGGAKGFDYAIGCNTACGSGGSNVYVGDISFTVNNVTLADFLPSPGDAHGNNGGFYFASDICLGTNTVVTNDVSTTTCSGTPGATGPVSAETPGTPRQVPEPLTLSLFGAGVLGAAAMRRRRKKA
jgi:hypothetical protein